MSSWFCSEEELSPAIKIMAFDAGYLITKNNPEKAKVMLPVAQDYMKTIDAGLSNETMNLVFRQASQELLGQIEDPMIQANIMFVLSQVKFDPKLPKVELSNKVIKGIVDNFVQGMSMVK